MKRTVLFIMALFYFVCAYAQPDTIAPEKIKTYTLNGYLKSLNGITFLPNNESVQWSLLHNRLNSRWQPNRRFTVALDVRSRIIYGESVKLGNYPANVLDKDSGLVDATFLPFNTRPAKMVTAVERLWAKYSNDKLELILGRQRINWGINLVWNPNDIFNTYSYVDFDYEERPGADAALIKYNIGDMSSIELAAKVGNYKDDNVYAFMFKTNKFNYDFQFLASWYQKDIAAGLGWAGNIGNIGFKGEGTYFHPQNKLNDSAAVFNAAVEFDYTIDGKVYMNTSYLFFNKGADAPLPAIGNILFDNITLSAKQLSLSRHAAFLQLKSISNPVLSGGFSALYFFEMNAMYLFPDVTYSINDRWEAALFLQSLWLKNKHFRSEMNNALIRIKYSF